MAITWELTITPMNVQTKEASVIAVRSDGTGGVRSYNVAKAPFNTPEQEDAVWDEIWAKHQDMLARETVVANFIDRLESAGKTNLEARG